MLYNKGGVKPRGGGVTYDLRTYAIMLLTWKERYEQSQSNYARIYLEQLLYSYESILIYETRQKILYKTNKQTKKFHGNHW